MAIELSFVDPSENKKPRAPRTVKKAVKVTGYIAPSGKIVIPQKSAQKIGVDFSSMAFRMATEQGKRKIKSLYLIHADGEEGTFTFSKAAKSAVLPLGVYLKKNGFDYDSKKYTFLIDTFEQDTASGYELKFEDPAEKAPYTGKRRGPKPKNQKG